MTLRAMSWSAGVALVALSVVAIFFGWQDYHHGHDSSVGVLAAFAGIWVVRMAYCRGLRRLGRDDEDVRAGARLGRNVLTLPLWLAAAYYAPFVERFGKAAVFFVPTQTYHGLKDIAFPAWLAVAGTVVAAPVEVLLASILCNVLVIEPLRAALGDGNPLVRFLGEYLPNVKVEGSSAL